MSKITVFTIDGCSTCDRVKQLLVSHGATAVNEISLTTSPEWTKLLFLLAKGDKSVPQVFFNSHHIGGSDEIEKMNNDGVLSHRVKECLEGGKDDEENSFPPPVRTPSNDEYVEIIPAEVRSKWQEILEDMGSTLRGLANREISSLVITLETPDSILVVCTAGPAKDTFVVGAAVPKGSEGSQKKAYCQVALEKNESLFLTDPTKVPGLEQNDLMLTYGYSHYAGTPWTVEHNKGTVVAMEKEANILKPEYMSIIEATRDKVIDEFIQYKKTNTL